MDFEEGSTMFALSRCEGGTNREDRFAALVTAWRRQAEEAKALGATVCQATLLEKCAREVESACARNKERLLSLGEAAHESGYSVDHFGRLIRNGRIPNAGRKGKPLIRECDLPRRPAMDRTLSELYDASADARLPRVRRIA